MLVLFSSLCRLELKANTSERTNRTNWANNTNNKTIRANHAKGAVRSIFHFSGRRTTKLEMSGNATGIQYWNLKWVRKKTVTLMGMNQARIKACNKRWGPRQAPQMAAPKAISRKGTSP